MAMVQIRRDPFARATLMREVCKKSEARKCAWCGEDARFYYHWEGDSVNSLPQMARELSKPFCSVGCWRDYHGS